jgi:hypothetical protein
VIPDAAGWAGTVLPIVCSDRRYFYLFLFSVSFSFVSSHTYLFSLFYIFFVAFLISTSFSSCLFLTPFAIFYLFFFSFLLCPLFYFLSHISFMYFLLSAFNNCMMHVTELPVEVIALPASALEVFVSTTSYSAKVEPLAAHTAEMPAVLQRALGLHFCQGC